jgi:hypothetical protein
VNDDGAVKGGLAAAVVSGRQKRGACACVDVGASRMADALGRRNKDGTTAPADAGPGGRLQCRQQPWDDEGQAATERLSDRMRRRRQLPEGWPS